MTLIVDRKFFYPSPVMTISSTKPKIESFSFYALITFNKESTYTLNSLFEDLAPYNSPFPWNHFDSLLR